MFVRRMVQVDALREWLAENFVGCTAPLFEAAGLLVTTFDYGRRKTLKSTLTLTV
jgi:hypothetical protein